MASKSRRRTRGAAGRRTPVGGGGGPSIPWAAVIVGGAIVAVILLVVYLFIQSQSNSGNRADAIKAEQDASTALPGQFVDLEKVYGGEYPATAGHVTRDLDYTADCSSTDTTLCNSNPPVGGPHWSGNCGEDPTTAPAFCGPASWGIYRAAWAPETLVHNMEHGGVVIWYNSTDPQVRDELEAVVKGRLDDHKHVVLAPYPDMEADMIALTSWTRIDKFPASDVTDDRINTFINTHERRFNPEGF